MKPVHLLEGRRLRRCLPCSCRGILSRPGVSRRPKMQRV